MPGTASIVKKFQSEMQIRKKKIVYKLFNNYTLFLNKIKKCLLMGLSN